MPIGAGLAGQVGIVNEATPNTPVAVTVFTEFDPGETLEARPNFAQGLGLRAGGLVPRAVRRILTGVDAGGDLSFDVPAKGLGKWVQAMMGSYATTATQLAASSAWQQIHNVGSADGKTFTCQKGVPSVDGVVNPLTLGGCKLTAWELSSGPNAIAKLKATIDAMSVAPTGAGALGLQTASYSASNPLFAFHQLTVQSFAAYTVVSGLWTPTAPVSVGVVRNVSLKGGQPKETARWQAGSTVKAEALVNDFQPITGQIDIDFASMALYNAFVANTSTGLALTFTGAAIPSGAGNNFLLQFIMPAVFWEQGSTPKIASNGVVTVSYPFTALDDGTNGALQVQIVSTDTTV